MLLAGWTIRTSISAFVYRVKTCSAYLKMIMTLTMLVNVVV